MAASWLAKTIRRIRDFANDANGKLRSDLGPEFDEIREPLRGLHTEWTQLQSWLDPRAALIQHLRDESITSDRHPLPTSGDGQPLPSHQPAHPPSRQLTAGQRPPIDLEAT